MNKAQLTSLVLLRMVVGWHFLYEGIVKFLNPNWSAKGYLAGSDSFFGLFSALGNSGMVGAIDFINTWGLIFVGLALILGIFNKAATLFGMALLAMYYLAYPAIPGFEGGAPTEGSYVLINKNIIEFFAMMVLYAFPTTSEVGLEKFLKKQSPATT